MPDDSQPPSIDVPNTPTPPPERREASAPAAYADQDLSHLDGPETVEVEYAGFHFLFSEPRTYRESMALISSADDAEALCRRSLDIIVAAPEPLDPILADLGPWKTAVLATEALDWINIPELLDEAASLTALHDDARASFRDDPPYDPSAGDW